MKTLKEALRERGYSTTPGKRMGRRDVIKDGRPVLRDKTAGEVWNWLNNRKKENKGG
jgi:hypothetical protein